MFVSLLLLLMITLTLALSIPFLFLLFFSRSLSLSPTAHIEERLYEDTARRQLSTSQEESAHQKLNWLTP